MAAINIKTTSKVTPQCYAYITPGMPKHNGWTKIGFTERDVEKRIKEQTHTVNADYKICWNMRAAYMTEPYGTFTDKDFHPYLKKLGITREKGTEWFYIEPNAAKMDFIEINGRFLDIIHSQPFIDLFFRDLFSRLIGGLDIRDLNR